MAAPDPGDSRKKDDPFNEILGSMSSRSRDRRERMVQEILANRRGEHRVPTWVLACVLVAMIGAIVAVLLLV
jgi:hypothetical protein